MKKEKLVEINEKLNYESHGGAFKITKVRGAKDTYCITYSKMAYMESAIEKVLNEYGFIKTEKKFDGKLNKFKQMFTI